MILIYRLDLFAHRLYLIIQVLSFQNLVGKPTFVLPQPMLLLLKASTSGIDLIQGRLAAFFVLAELRRD